jgi:hypothetical protein
VVSEQCTLAAETDCLDQDQANEKDYSHEGFGFSFKKTQADIVAKFMSSKEVKYFKVSETFRLSCLGSSSRTWSTRNVCAREAAANAA